MSIYIKKLLRESLEGTQNSTMSPQEQQIVQNIIGENINEDGNGIIDRLRSYAQKGMITAGIIMALMSNDALAQEQKQEVMQVAKTELDSGVITKIQQQLKLDTGLEFSTDYVGDTFAVSDSDNPFELPTNDELKTVLVKAGLPTQFIDNIYVNYQENQTGDDHAAFIVSVRLKEHGGFTRFSQSGPRNKAFGLIVNALESYRPGGENGKDVTFNLEVVAPSGQTIGNRTLNFRS